MLDILQDKLQRVFKTLRGEGTLTEWHIDEALKEIRMALLEADVNFKVVRAFTDRVREKAVGEAVLVSLTPVQQVTKIVRDELIVLLGGETEPLDLPRPLAIHMLVGLQGSGKTTTAGKLGAYLAKKGRNPMLVPADTQRLAAIEQLHTIALAVGVAVYRGTENTPREICKAALADARQRGHDVLIVDTAGRLHIDEPLMEELAGLKAILKPQEILFVADAMTGQDAVKSAQQFNERLGVTGVILTKMDGDARGGAALSIKSVVARPIKLIGTGEKYDALEPYHPERIASRILGLGDVLSLIEKAEAQISVQQARKIGEKLGGKNAFTLEDLLDQLGQLRKMGSLQSLLGMLPRVGALKNLSKAEVDEGELDRMRAIIGSMTRRERLLPQIINGSRRKRIAKGSGTRVQDVNRLLKQFAQMRKMMSGFDRGMFGKKLGKVKFPSM